MSEEWDLLGVHFHENKGPVIRSGAQHVRLYVSQDLFNQNPVMVALFSSLTEKLAVPDPNPHRVTTDHEVYIAAIIVANPIRHPKRFP